MKAVMEAIQQLMIKAKKDECVNLFKRVNRLCKKFGFTAEILKVAIAEGHKKA